MSELIHADLLEKYPVSNIMGIIQEYVNNVDNTVDSELGNCHATNVNKTTLMEEIISRQQSLP